MMEEPYSCTGTFFPAPIAFLYVPIGRKKPVSLGMENPGETAGKNQQERDI